MTKYWLAAVAFGCTFLVGCDVTTQEEIDQLCTARTRSRMHRMLLTHVYEGHSYIIFDGVRAGGITHDPDCPCRQRVELMGNGVKR